MLLKVERKRMYDHREFAAQQAEHHVKVWATTALPSLFMAKGFCIMLYAPMFVSALFFCVHNFVASDVTATKCFGVMLAPLWT